MSTQSGSGDERSVIQSAGLEKSLSAYASAAAAAGVSVLALALPAEARIVYTPANTPIPVNGGFAPLDVNHDGVADFSFSNRSAIACCHGTVPLLLQVFPKDQNAVWGRGTFNFSYWSIRDEFAAALHRGFTVGPDKSYFLKGRAGLLGFYIGTLSTGKTSGQWQYTKGRYLGLKFLINGQVHYGWARLSVGGPGQGGIPATITGYAYETIPNKPIITGKTKGPDGMLPSDSLGALALGRH